MPQPSRPLVVIPARIQSTRFPKKVLAPLAGKPMVQHVWENACKLYRRENVVIATDHHSVKDHIEKLGGTAWLTPSNLPSGTDRVAFVARDLQTYDYIINLQGDEPLIQPEHLELLMARLYRSPDLPMATLAVKKESWEDFQNPNVVKVVENRLGNALFFSRQNITAFEPPLFLKHIGVYAFRRKALFQFCGLPKSSLEKAERLEQLRALEYGLNIGLSISEKDTIAVDTPEDLARVEAQLMKKVK